MRFGAILDDLISVISPRRGLQRHQARKLLTQIRSSQYAAAKTTRVSGDWSPVDSGVNDIIAASSSAVRARVRQLVRDFPYFARAVNVVTSYTVGSGIMFQSRVTDPSGKLDKTSIQKIEDAANFWMDQADVSGKLHYYELMEMAKRQETEPGEFLLIKHYPSTPGRYLPYALQIIEPDWLTDISAQVTNPKNAIHQGVEYETATGRPMAYHFTDPNGWGKTIRVESDRVIHGYKHVRPGQLRGISPFAPGVLVAKDLSEFMDATMDTAKLASKYLALITTENPASMQLGLTSYETASGTTQKIDTLENAIIEYLNPGEKVTFPSNPNPGDNFDPFVRLILTMFSIVAEVPYELISGDYRGLNYSVSRTVRNDFAFQLRPAVTRHVRHFCTPTLAPFFDISVMSGKLQLPKYFANPAPWVKAEWQPPGMEAIDPLKESKANIDEMNTGTRSPYEIVKARGRDLEDVYREIKQAKDLAEEYGLSFSEVSTALAGNPAAIMAEGGNGRSKHIGYNEINMMDLLDKIDEITGRA